MTNAVRLTFFLMTFVVAGTGQNPDSSKSQAEIARQSRKDPKQAKIVIDEDSPKQPKPAIPDIFSGGLDNIDEIMQSIEAYRTSHNPKETEAVIRIWFEKHDSMLANAIEQNKQIDQRERDRQMGYLASDAQPRSQQEYAEAQRIEIISRREDFKRKQENSLLSARIQQTFGRVRSSLAAKGVRYEWFKIRCGNGNCSY